MSIVSLIMATLLLLQMHACNARHTFDLVSYSKDVDEKSKLVHETDIKGFPVFQDTEKETYLEDLSVFATLDNNSRALMEVQGLKGKPRSMLESKSEEETKEATNASEGESVEDAVVMDYVQPHRKSPIHNQH